MAISAFAVKVPAAEPLVADLRAQFDATASLGVPAHITVLVPFMPPQRITPAVLERAQQALDRVPAFFFSLAAVARFPTTAYLVPEPAAPFVALTNALAQAFPDFQPYGGAHEGVVVPHLTVAHGDAAQAEAAAAELQRRMGTLEFPVEAVCDSVVLLENSTGRWMQMHDFGLQQGPPA
ncbi:2'-5' RNA ligase family protein [Variovorax sp. M-6]|uniref:2'-5' RNA ligase family protein n=1 Tax=Variovorax sp. M-6 TaxID=3233041 RepID=UPI003F96126D